MVKNTSTSTTILIPGNWRIVRLRLFGGWRGCGAFAATAGVPRGLMGEEGHCWCQGAQCEMLKLHLPKLSQLCSPSSALPPITQVSGRFMTGNRSALAAIFLQTGFWPSPFRIFYSNEYQRKILTPISLYWVDLQKVQISFQSWSCRIHEQWERERDWDGEHICFRQLTLSHLSPLVPFIAKLSEWGKFCIWIVTDDNCCVNKHS